MDVEGASEIRIHVASNIYNICSFIPFFCFILVRVTMKAHRAHPRKVEEFYRDCTSRLQGTMNRHILRHFHT